MKNTTSAKWAIIGHKVTKRQKHGKASEIYIGDKIVPEQRAKKEMSRHFSSHMGSALSAQ